MGEVEEGWLGIQVLPTEALAWHYRPEGAVADSGLDVNSDVESSPELHTL